MKLLFASVAVLCVAVAVAQIGYGKKNVYGTGYNAAGIDNHHNGAYGQVAGHGDYRKYAKKDNVYGNAGQQQYAKNNVYNQAAGSAAAKSAHENNAYNNQAAATKENAARGGAAAYKQSHYNDANAHYANKNNANKAGYNNNFANKNRYNKAHVLSDSIHYGFDKKFNKNADEDGIYSVSNHNDAHKLDDYRDKSRFYDAKQGYHANSAKKADAAHAIQESKFNKAAANKAYAAQDYADKANKINKAGQHSSLHHKDLDAVAGKSKYSDNAKDSSLRKYNDYATKDNAFGRQGAIARNGAHAGAAAQTGRGYGHGRGVGVGHGYGRGINGVAAKNNGYYGDAAKHADAAANSAALKNGKFGAAENQYYKDHDSAKYAKHDNLRDHEQGDFKSGLYKADGAGHNNAAHSNAASQGAAARKYADAASNYLNAAANSDKYAAARNNENLKHQLHDSNSNSKTVKKFHTSKKVGGNNYERLNFDRKRLDNDYADNAAYKAANAKKFNNDVYSANAKNNQYKDTAAAAKQAHNQYYHNNAAAAQKAKSVRDNAYANRNAAAKNAYNKDYSGNQYNAYKANHDNVNDATHNAKGQYYGKTAAAHDNAIRDASGIKYASVKAPQHVGLGVAGGIARSAPVHATGVRYNQGYAAPYYGNNYGYAGNGYNNYGYPQYGYQRNNGYNGYNGYPQYGYQGNNYGY
ncbi:hypothetical protein LOTGIDRAFT_238000 [Lottia gigantea]|uniref:Uncharacterized protein n=1 Tax=Lottia gigantea TaxID=225164 RepID=V4AEF3_LOTGI|nr:hypothetical protein LOTGIDRAFT_238000 [Lottia gigantea]ESP02374.1 hypothetical protein LOTGIDRAFT_238000 [Lottia gigantea]